MKIIIKILIKYFNKYYFYYKPYYTMDPLTRIPIWLQRESASAIEWVVRITDPSYISMALFKTVKSFLLAPGSTPELGSSRINTFVPPIKLHASDNFRLLPPLKCIAYNNFYFLKSKIW